MNQALLSSRKMDYCTPPELFDVLNDEFNFVLDAAATDKSAKCKRYFTLEQNALQQSWQVRHGSVFCNPPYGREIGTWIKKGYEESQKGTTVVMLVPARTDTQWFHRYIFGRAEVRYIKGRIRFTDEDGNEYPPAPFPSMVVIFRKEGNYGR